MIIRWIVHFECHWGYRPRFSIRRAPRAGDWVENGGERGELIGCPECSSDGFLFVPRPPGYGLQMLLAMTEEERARLVAEKNRIAPRPYRRDRGAGT